MKVLIIYHAGAMQNARSIFQELSKLDGISLTAIIPERMKVDRVYDPAGWLHAPAKESSNGYRLEAVPLRDPSRYQRGFDRSGLRAILASLQPDIIHALDEPVSGYLFQTAWERLTTSRRSRLLFYGFENLPFQMRTLSEMKWKLTWSQVAGGAAANSESLENLKRIGFPKDRPLERIFWGIPTEIFRPMDRRLLKNELQLTCDRIVGFVGRLSVEKGVGVFCEAVRRLPQSVHAVVIGAGPMRPELERIHLYDVMEPEALAKYINCMDALCIPSLTTDHWKEQYGRVIAEAMACGVPVVGSDSGAIPEVMGNAGFIVPENDAARLAEALNKAIFDESTRAADRERGFKRVEQELSCKAMARNLFKFYERVLGS